MTLLSQQGFTVKCDALAAPLVWAQQCTSAWVGHMAAVTLIDHPALPVWLPCRMRLAVG